MDNLGTHPKIEVDVSVKADLIPVKIFPIDPRTLAGSLQSTYVSLLDHAFPVPSGQHYLEDFPVWDPRLNGTFAKEVLRLGAYVGTELAGVASGRIAVLKPQRPGALAIRMGIVGAVATDPRWRGQGVATQLVKAVCEELESRGVALIALWGSEHTLYRRLGFELCGMQARIPAKNVIGPAPVRTPQVHEGWTPGIFKLMMQRPGGLELSADDVGWITAHRHTQWWWTGGSSGAAAYCALGRGIDLNGIIHEWGGEPEALRALLAEVVAKNPECEILGPPDTLEKLGAVVPLEQREYLCMLKVSDLDSLQKAYGIKADLTAYHAKELPNLLFGPEPAPPSLSGIFPLPLWIWGLDAA